MSFIFGPVPSRRLGLSLGIDPNACCSPFVSDGCAPRKICNWNCAYCQLGRTISFTTSRMSFFPPEAMFKELRATLETEDAKKIDWVTFVGSGEPTLNSDLGTLIRGVKTITRLPVAVITNGSLLSNPKVRDELMAADAVMPTLDAGTRDLYRRINRPHPDFCFEHHLRGLAAFRSQFTGKLWLELMLIDGVNDDEASLRDLAVAIQRIEPDEVHLVLPTRPPSEAWVKPATEEGVIRAHAIVGGVARLLYPEQAEFERGAIRDPQEAAAAIVARHPMSDDELRHALKAWGTDDPENSIRTLQASGKIASIERYGKIFWRAPYGAPATTNQEH